MSDLTRIPPFNAPKGPRAIHALHPDLSDPMAAICDLHGLGCGTGIPLTLHRLVVACRGIYVVDECGADIPLAFNPLFVAPSGAGQMAVQALADQLVRIETEVAPCAIEQLARSEACAQLRVEHCKQIEAAIKGAARKKVRLQALLAQRREFEACEPQEAHYPEHLSEMVAWNQRLSDFEFSIDQAELESDAETARALRTARKALLAKPPSSFEADHRRWELKRAAVDAQILLLQGADEEVTHLVEQKQSLLAEDAAAIKPVMPQLFHWNKGVAEVRKTVASGWPAAVAMYAGEAVVRTLAKHRMALADACGGHLRTVHPPGRVLLNVVATTTPAAFLRDMKAIGAEGAAALGAMFVIAADTQHFDLVNKRPPADCLAAFDDRLRAMVIENVGAMLRGDFQPQRITVSAEAASWLDVRHSALHAQRMGGELPPALDAFLTRARTMYYVIAGLLHVWRREPGPLSCSTMQDAIDVGDYLIENFERTVMMAREVPAHEIDGTTLARALCGHVDKQLEKAKVAGKDKPKPNAFEIRLSTVHSRAKSFGLTRARVDVALKVLLAWGWIRARQDGLDTVFDLDQRYFAPGNRPF